MNPAVIGGVFCFPHLLPSRHPTCPASNYRAVLTTGLEANVWLKILKIVVDISE
jgi:hypothetical protein